MNLLNVDHLVKPDLDLRLLALLAQHQDLCRLRLALTEEIEALERRIEVVEQNTRHARDGVALAAQN